MEDGRVVALLELEDERSRVRLVPDLGGAIADMDAKLSSRLAPVLRRWDGPQTGWIGVGSNILVPFSNRISGGGFYSDQGGSATFHPIHPNVENLDPFPLHGDGLLKSWQVVSHSSTDAVLRLVNGEIGDFRYTAEVRYLLSSGTLNITLGVTNKGIRLPFGGGFHPWLPRYSDTRLQFNAEAVWLEDNLHLPTEQIALKDYPEWDIGSLGFLPKGLINNAFTGWDGHAKIEQKGLGLTAVITAQAPLDTAIIYSPDCHANFFCFEPVTHSVDAHNQPGQPGLAILEQGETMALNMKIGWLPYGT